MVIDLGGGRKQSGGVGGDLWDGVKGKLIDTGWYKIVNS